MLLQRGFRKWSERFLQYNLCFLRVVYRVPHAVTARLAVSNAKYSYVLINLGSDGGENNFEINLQIITFKYAPLTARSVLVLISLLQ